MHRVSLLFSHLDRKLRYALESTEPWTNVYGVTRTLIASASLLTLLFNDTEVLFKEIAGLQGRVFCGSYSSLGLYCLVPETHLEVARWASIIVLILAASGWLPRFTAIPHWYVTLSYPVSASGIDGGDQIAANLTLLLLPICLTDSRTWHWQLPKRRTARYPIGNLVAVSSYITIQAQISIVYFQSFIAKTTVPEWLDGTALYYWFNSTTVGAPHYLRPLFQPVLTTDLTAIVTWSVLLLELLLAVSPLTNRRLKRFIFPLGIAFHLGIAFFMGIFSFAIVMIAALILHLRRSNELFSLSKLTIKSTQRREVSENA